MGLTRVDDAVIELIGAEIPARRGYPGKMMPCLTETVAAVNVQRISQEETVLAVQVLSPQDGPTCEDTACEAMQALTDLGATCTMGECRYESKAGVFVCPVTATWKERPECTVKAEGKTLSYAVEVTVQRELSRVQVTDPDTGETAEECRDMGWSITIEELLPADYLPEKEGMDAFPIYIYRTGGSERYTGCQWLSVLLENVPGGIRRRRVARTWEARSLNTE